MLQLPKQASERLKAIEDRLRNLREEKRRADAVRNAATDAVATVPEGEDDSAQYQAAQETVRAVAAIQSKIEQAQEEQTALLKTAGGPTAWTGSESGWSEAA